MKRQLELTRTFYPEQLYIELSPQQIENAWDKVTQNHSNDNDIVKWRAYLNYLIVEAIPQIESELYLEEKLGHYPDNLAPVLNYVNGTILTLGETRLVAIPCDVDSVDLCVPQELVDLPKLAGDYYLGVHINLEEEWLRFWGVCSHRKLTTEGAYDTDTRNYYLDRDELVEDLESMLIAREICTNERGKYKFSNLPLLSENEANQLLAQLQQPDCYVPRLALDLEKWLSLFANYLVENPVLKKNTKQSNVKLPRFSELLKNITLRNTSADNWNFQIAMINTRLTGQKYSRQMNKDAISTTKRALGSPNQAKDTITSIVKQFLPVVGAEFLTGDSSITEITTDNFTAYCIKLINHTDQDIVKLIALELGIKLGDSNEKIPEEIVNTLANRIETIDDRETAWQLALTLGKLSSKHPLGAVGVKTDIEFPIDDWFEIFFAIKEGKDNSIDVLVQIKSASQDYLPVGLQTFLLDETDKELSKVVIEDEDKTHLTFYFTGTREEFFSVKLSLGEHSLIENFQI